MIKIFAFCIFTIFSPHTVCFKGQILWAEEDLKNKPPNIARNLPSNISVVPNIPACHQWLSKSLALWLQDHLIPGSTSATSG